MCSWEMRPRFLDLCFFVAASVDGTCCVQLLALLRAFCVLQEEFSKVLSFPPLLFRHFTTWIGNVDAVSPC